MLRIASSPSCLLAALNALADAIVDAAIAMLDLPLPDKTPAQSLPGSSGNVRTSADMVNSMYERCSQAHSGIEPRVADSPITNEVAIGCCRDSPMDKACETEVH